MPRYVLVIFLLVCTSTVACGNSTTQSDKSSTTISDFMQFLEKSTSKKFTVSEKFAAVIGAVEGVELDAEGTSLEIYRYSKPFEELATETKKRFPLRMMIDYCDQRTYFLICVNEVGPLKNLKDVIQKF